MVPHAYNKKPLSVAVEELYESKVKILSEEDAGEEESLSIQEGSGEPRMCKTNASLHKDQTRFTSGFMQQCAKASSAALRTNIQN